MDCYKKHIWSLDITDQTNVMVNNDFQIIYFSGNEQIPKDTYKMYDNYAQ